MASTSVQLGVDIICCYVRRRQSIKQGGRLEGLELIIHGSDCKCLGHTDLIDGCSIGYKNNLCCRFEYLSYEELYLNLGSFGVGVPKTAVDSVRQ